MTSEIDTEKPNPLEAIELLTGNLDRLAKITERLVNVAESQQKQIDILREKCVKHGIL